MEKQWIQYYIFWVCDCGLRYPAYIAHASYCHLWPAPLYNIFPTLSHKRQDFRKNIIEHKMCFEFLYKFYLKFFSYSTNYSARYCHKRALVFKKTLVRFSWNLNFLHRFSKIPRIPNFMKIRPVRTELFHGHRQTDGRTDMTKLTVAFRNSSNAPTNHSITAV
jgi:hypothetical protein